MSIKYSVNIEKFAERHFIKCFERKYHRNWEITAETLMREFQSFDILFLRKIAEMIVETPEVKICKVEFKISGTNQSRHGSGNRCIVAVHKNTCVVSVLLIYHKIDLCCANETATWKQIIRDNYSEYSNLL